MTELKTLKELPCAEGEDEFWHTNHSLPNTPRCIDESDLRAEAIKWIKAIDSDKPESNNLAFKLGFTAINGHSCMYGARTILMKFFNISEEDLK